MYGFLAICERAFQRFTTISITNAFASTPAAKSSSMMTLTNSQDQVTPETGATHGVTRPVAASCYSVTVFTQCWNDVRDFYVNILRAEVVSERAGRYLEIILGGVPITIRMAEHGETVSYFHLYISMKNLDAVLGDLRRRGIVVTTVGPYTNFRDPEGRVIKLSEERTIVS